MMRRGVSPLRSVFFEKPGHQERHDNAEEIHGEHGEPLHAKNSQDFLLRNAGRNEQGVNWQASGTTHQRSDKDGDESILGSLDGACRHDAGNRAGKGTQHGNETFAVQADFAHEPIHEKSGASHVTGVLE